MTIIDYHSFCLQILTLEDPDMEEVKPLIILMFRDETHSTLQWKKMAIHYLSALNLFDKQSKGVIDCNRRESKQCGLPPFCWATTQSYLVEILPQQFGF